MLARLDKQRRRLLFKILPPPGCVRRSLPRAKAEEEASRKAVRYSAFYGGKVGTMPKVPILSFDNFSIWYTPGVAGVSKCIQRGIELSFEYTNRWNTIAMITDGSRVLG